MLYIFFQTGSGKTSGMAAFAASLKSGSGSSSKSLSSSRKQLDQSLVEYFRHGFVTFLSRFFSEWFLVLLFLEAFFVQEPRELVFRTGIELAVLRCRVELAPLGRQENSDDEEEGCAEAQVKHFPSKSGNRYRH